MGLIIEFTDLVQVQVQVTLIKELFIPLNNQDYIIHRNDNYKKQS